jgi:hypothetical protein
MPICCAGDTLHGEDEQRSQGSHPFLDPLDRMYAVLGPWVVFSYQHTMPFFLSCNAVPEAIPFVVLVYPGLLPSTYQRIIPQEVPPVRK